MAKFNEEIAVSICEYLCGHSVVTHVCRAHAITATTYWDWVSRSTRGELPEITWLGQTAPFHFHIQNAKKIFANHMLDAMTERARWGSERRITYQGKEMFRVRTDIPPDITDPDVLEMLYDQRDHFLRDANGHLVHLTEKIEPPVQLQLAVAAASFAAYQPHSSQQIEVINRGEAGVMRVSGTPKAKPVQIAAPVEIVQEPEPVEVEVKASSLAANEHPVEVEVDRSPAYTPPAQSSKVPIGTVEIFRVEATDDLSEVIGTDTNAAAPANPSPVVRAPTPDIYLHVSVRAAKRKIHDGERANGAVEAQIMRALQLDLTPEARERRLQELVGSHVSAEDRSEGLGAGRSPSKGAPVKVV